MTNEPNLKEIERKSYMSYHQDGLLDIVSGAFILGFGLGILIDRMWESGFGSIMPALLVATILPIWVAAKRRITMPRIGFVKFGPSGATTRFMAVLIGVAIVGLGVSAAFSFVAFQGGSSIWLDSIFQNGMLIIGIASLAVCALFGYSMGLKRLYAYGLLALIAFAIGQFMSIFIAYLLLVLGIVIMCAGFALLISFIRKYPLQGEKAIAS